ncbi:hypothetical protein ACFPRL_09650 [Pseudoclavibacter helvolus]
MDGFVMRGAVPNVVQLLQCERDLLLSVAKVTRPVWKSPMCRWHPKCRQIPRFDEISPESESEFSDDSPVYFRATPLSSCAATGLRNVCQTARVKWCDVEPGDPSRPCRGPRS